jgi:hypothetical protein
MIATASCMCACVLAGKKLTVKLRLCVAKQLQGRSAWQRSTPAGSQRCRASWMHAALQHATLTQRWQQHAARSLASLIRWAAIRICCLPARSRWAAADLCQRLGLPGMTCCAVCLYGSCDAAAAKL